ncbi:hypothetical protein EJB05_09411, partial [Eragrostis curvula]
SFPCALIAVWRPSNFHAVALCRTYATGTPQGSTLATRSSQSKLLSPGSAPGCGDPDFPSERWVLSQGLVVAGGVVADLIRSYVK